MSQELIEFHANIGKQWFTKPSLATAHRIASQGEERGFFSYPYLSKDLKQGPFELRLIAILKSWTVEPVAMLMKTIGLVHGIALDIFYNSQGTYAQAILRENSWPYKGNFNAIILTAEADDNLDDLAAVFRSHCDVPLLVHGIPHKKHRDLDGVPFRADELLSIAQTWMRWIYPLIKTPSKVLVTDLDDTLWRGILGEDGAKSIYPNWILQDALLNLWTQGVILAACSKNNEAEVLNVLRNHPGMSIRPRHLAAWRINWQDKVTNLHELAEELDVGLDSFVFLDDSPIERGLVRSQLPEVIVPELPDDPSLHANVLKQGLWFEKGMLTEEDRSRGQYYAQQRQHKEAQATMTLEDYYRSLEQRVEIRPMTAETLPRVVQLLQKTNQFNLTTKRYTKQELIQMDSDEWEIFTLRAKDKFGDNGIVGVAILHFHHNVCEIDSFLLSCRAIGRTIETALLAHIASYAETRLPYATAAFLVGDYLSTPKNEPAKDFYALHGFEKSSFGAWFFDVSMQDIQCPEWITYE